MTEKITNNSFKFFANFLYAIDKLPEEKRAKACYEFCRFGITGELPKDENLSMFCVGVSASVQKYQGRGGNHNPTGKNQWSNEVKSGQKGQNGLNEQTETETEIKKERKRKKKPAVVSDDWQPTDETKQKLAEKGIEDIDACVEYFKGQCQAKGIEYVNYDRAILNWNFDVNKFKKSRFDKPVSEWTNDDFTAYAVFGGRG